MGSVTGILLDDGFDLLQIFEICFLTGIDLLEVVGGRMHGQTMTGIGDLSNGFSKGGVHHEEGGFGIVFVQDLQQTGRLGAGTVVKGQVDDAAHGRDGRLLGGGLGGGRLGFRLGGCGGGRFSGQHLLPAAGSAFCNANDHQDQQQAQQTQPDGRPVFAEHPLPLWYLLFLPLALMDTTHQLIVKNSLVHASSPF